MFCHFKLNSKWIRAAYGGSYRLGCVRTEHIKRIAKELVNRFPNRFSSNFDENKRLVSMFLPGATPKVRNQIAGYITHMYGRLATEQVSDKQSANEDKNETE
ncbi:MAG: 30S ribosomal protein S17e [Candidatus Bathyarchaeia archaeon]